MDQLPQQVIMYLVQEPSQLALVELCHHCWVMEGYVTQLAVEELIHQLMVQEDSQQVVAHLCELQAANPLPLRQVMVYIKTGDLKGEHHC